MNATDQTELELVEKRYPLHQFTYELDIHWLIAQLRAAQDEIAALKSGDGMTTAWMLGFHQRDDEVRQLKAEVERLKADKWQPIESAPKDGKEVILRVKMRAGIPGKYLVGHYMPGGFCIEDHPAIDSGWYFWNGSQFDKASEPTHWQPLPEPPKI